MASATYGFGFRMELRGYADRIRPQHCPRTTYLSKDDDPHGGWLRICGSGKVKRDRTRVEILDSSDALKSTNDADMLKLVTTIFAAADVRRIRGVDQCGVKRGLRFCIGRSRNGY